VQNQATPVEILSPAIPANWCPTGSWADVFNNYQTLFLNNSTINIPGLNDVTPQEIATINQNIFTLQNEYSALAANQFSIVQNHGQVSVANQSGTQKSSITFYTPMPDSSYQISAAFGVGAGSGGNTVNATWGVVNSSITNTGMTLWFANNADDINTLYWWVLSIKSSS
jgi:hypothetical protein